MKVLFRALLVLFTFSQDVSAALESECFTKFNNKIVGGTDAVRREFPYQVSLQASSGFHFCGGSLIGSKWVLTAAHCGEVNHVEIGRHALSADDKCVEKITVKKQIKHAGYNSFTMANDIMLLELVTESEYEPATPLTKELEALEAIGVEATVSGWGTLSSGGATPDILQKVQVPIQTNSRCNEQYGGDIISSMICAGLEQGGKDSCQGDSGGPMAVKSADHSYIVGVVSWGAGCAAPGFFGVYTRVSSHQSWLCEKANLVCDGADDYEPFEGDAEDGSYSDVYNYGSYEYNWWSDWYNDWCDNYDPGNYECYESNWWIDDNDNYGSYYGSYGYDDYDNYQSWDNHESGGSYGSWNSYNMTGTCDSHADCDAGNYCDQSGQCWTCAFIDYSVCDAKDSCCSSTFLEQCPTDPHKCDGSDKPEDEFGSWDEDAWSHWWSDWYSNNNNNGDDYYSSYTSDYIGGDDYVNWWEYGYLNWWDQYGSGDLYFDDNWWGDEYGSWWLDYGSYSSYGSYGSYGSSGDSFYSPDSLPKCDTHADCATGSYCDTSGACYTCDYIEPGLCDAKKSIQLSRLPFEPNTCCSTTFLGNCPADPYKCNVDTTSTPPPTSKPTTSNQPPTLLPELDNECRRRYATSKIVGGTDAVKREFPFMVSLQDSFGHFCGGSLINHHMVLTAAHCGRPEFVQIGLHVQGVADGCTETIKVVDYKPHPQYDDWSMENDLAILVLESASAYAPIQLMTPELMAEVKVGDLVTLAGWGTMRQGGNLASTLQKVDVPLVNQGKCKAIYSNLVDSMVCAGLDQGGKDSCQGDSGGPMFLGTSDGHYFQAGIVSFGNGCAMANAYGVYTRVSSFLDFICSASGVGCSSSLPPSSVSITATRAPSKQPTKQPTRQPTKQPTRQPTKQPTKQTTKAPTRQPTEPAATDPPTRESTTSGFNWGGSCDSGEGEFTITIDESGQTVAVGEIPIDKYDLQIYLDADEDMDITLYDIDDTDPFREGQAVVAWCSGTDCNKGVLGSSSKVATADYKGMQVTYSGYNGDGTATGKGKEYIFISATTTNLEMRAFAFRAGSATIRYSWGRGQSACCAGLEACRGSFTTFVRKGEVIDIGVIPKNKKNVKIMLESSVDVDVQLYDLDDKQQFDEGKALIAFCVQEGCNSGKLTTASQKTESYWGVDYTYSGYEGKSASQKGHEFIEVNGITNRDLSMKAYGFQAGSAVIIYEYWEPREDQAGGFDFSGCDAGSGSFNLDLEEPKTTVTVGTIPQGVWNVRVYLESDSDVDVTLYDMDETELYKNGKAVVAWCSTHKDPHCNLGLLKDNGKKDTMYHGMKVSYSGYGGDGGKGKEWIAIEGETTRTFSFRAFAFTTGSATVRYEWDSSQSACCLGTAICTGSFEAHVSKLETVDIGELPVGLRDVNIQLSSAADVDIQLYDLDDTQPFAEGQAIVAFCVSADCNKGVLGSTASQEIAQYQGRTYTYSGFKGGDEFVRVDGLTNRRLMMKAYGYKTGKATVLYSYWNQPSIRGN